jgi:nucleotide-binding universal stress UspA family protein
MLVLLDGSPMSERVLTAAGTLLTLLKGEALLLRVLEPPPASTYAHMPHLAAQLRNDEREAGRQYLEATRNRLPQDIAIRIQAAIGLPVAEIERVISAELPDVVALATHGRGTMSRFVLGSVASELVRKATTPLLLVGPSFLESHARA